MNSEGNAVMTADDAFNIGASTRSLRLWPYDNGVPMKGFIDPKLHPDYVYKRIYSAIENTNTIHWRLKDGQ